MGKKIVSLNDQLGVRWTFDGLHIEIWRTIGEGGGAVTQKEVIIFRWGKANLPVGLF